MRVKSGLIFTILFIGNMAVAETVTITIDSNTSDVENANAQLILSSLHANGVSAQPNKPSAGKTTYSTRNVTCYGESNAATSSYSCETEFRPVLEGPAAKLVLGLLRNRGIGSGSVNQKAQAHAQYVGCTLSGINGQNLSCQIISASTIAP